MPHSTSSPSAMDKLVFTGDVRLDGEVRHGGLFVRGDGDVDIGKLDLQSAQGGACAEGGLLDFIAAQEAVLQASGHIQVDLDIGGEIAGETLRGGEPCQVAFSR